MGCEVELVLSTVMAAGLLTVMWDVSRLRLWCDGGRVSMSASGYDGIHHTGEANHQYVGLVVARRVVLLSACRISARLFLSITVAVTVVADTDLQAR